MVMVYELPKRSVLCEECGASYYQNISGCHTCARHNRMIFGKLCDAHDGSLMFALLGSGISARQGESDAEYLHRLEMRAFLGMSPQEVYKASGRAARDAAQELVAALRQAADDYADLVQKAGPHRWGLLSVQQWRELLDRVS
jgi:hypothetical protein